VKRWFHLCWTRKFKPSADFIILNNSLNGNSFLRVEAKLQNILLLNVNGRYFFIQHDEAELILTIPHNNKFEKTLFNGVGVFYRTKKTVFNSTNNSLLKINSLLFDRTGHAKTKIKKISTVKMKGQSEPKLSLVIPTFQDLKIALNETSNISTILPEIYIDEFEEAELKQQLNKLL
jgi:hypothetical protein